MTQGSNAARTPISLPVGRQLSIDERRRLVAESLRVGNPDSRSGDLPAQADPRQECQIELPVDAIRPYEDNPRRSGNERFEDIKASVRANGIRTPLTVTRRPGEAHFIVEAGGNTSEGFSNLGIACGARTGSFVWLARSPSVVSSSSRPPPPPPPPLSFCCCCFSSSTVIGT